jgi:hypothetical protein
LLVKRASASRSSGEWSESDYDVLADGVVIGRIMETAAAPVGTPVDADPVLRQNGRNSDYFRLRAVELMSDRPLRRLRRIVRYLRHSLGT